MNKHKKLYDIAYRFRKKLLGGGPSIGYCYDASWGLVEELGSFGIPAHVIKGYFLVQRPYLFSPTKLRHYWVKSGRCIIDITADQFNIYITKIMPKVYISQAWSELYKMEESLAL